MSGVYERPFEVTYLEENEVPAQKNASVKVGGYLKAVASASTRAEATEK